MTGFIKFFIEEMGKEVIKLTCAGVVNIPKYVTGIQGVHDAVRPCSLALIPDEFKTQKICKKSVEHDPWSLKYIPDHLKTQDMCNKAVKNEPDILKFDFLRACSWLAY